MKLIIQIPCYNESETLHLALAALPRQVEGFDSVEWLVIDDGSMDNTVDVARQCGVDHIVSHTINMGLAKAFMTGLDACLKMGADVIVNTDADNQYDAACIPDLVAPILERRADLVIGARPVGEIEDFSPLKKKLQKLGSWVVRKASRTDIPDAPSGFRALSREAALRTNVFNNYTYTLETIIQAGQRKMAICSVPVRVNGFLRPSRLMKSTLSYIKRSIITIFRIFMLYRPAFFLGTLSLLFFVPGFAFGVRFLYFLAIGEGDGHVQSVVLTSLLIMLGVIVAAIAVISDLLAVNRMQLEEVQYLLRKADIQKIEETRAFVKDE
ncbi:MAG: glycosyltransferase family 2 protein [Deltaproteobacteria bacterium]|jgi:glycosyltransferase involved in cell wall biosynthesis|nr:glycosyltransferase family 2 protein [Deltaproteobacteria bacterium]